MFYYLFALIYIAICVALIFFILIQSNKGMGLSGAFGAMGAGDSVFGSSGGMNVMIKITIGLSVVFALSTLALTVFPPPSRSGGIIEQQYSNRPQSTADLVNQSQTSGANNAAVPAEPNSATSAK